MENVEKAVQQAIAIANDPAHGYSQLRRWGPDFDCSSLVIQCFDDAGFPVKSWGASFTGNMVYAFCAVGFERLVFSPSLDLRRGDILLNVQHHTAIYLGSGQIVEAAIDELGGTAGNTPGDQTGGEIHIRSFYNYPWDYVLRWPEKQPAYDDPACSYTAGNAIQTYAPQIRSGDFGPAVAAAQAALNYHGYGPLSCDGVFSKTMTKAVKAFQTKQALEVDGIIGPQTWRSLLYWR